jgi:RNA polymerase sporulation-specific sigma factor
MTAEIQKNSKCTAEADLELLRRYQNGDETAFPPLLEAHYGLIKCWMRFVLTRAPWANPDDLMQEACIGFDLAAKKFDFSRNGDFHALARILCIGEMFDSPEVRLAKRTLQKNYRKVIDAQDELMKELNRKPTLEEVAKKAELSVNQVETALNMIVPLPSPLEEADGFLASEDPYRSQLVGDLLSQLGSDQADVIMLRYFHGYEFGEIASALGKSEGAVKMLHQRAIKKLRDIILGRGGQKDGT